MQGNSIVRSWFAIGLGTLFAGGTCYVLFEDVLRRGAIITTDHVMTLLVLIGTIAAGHMIMQQKRIAAIAGLGVLFAAGTFYCVTQSAARNAEVTVGKTLDLLNANAERKKLEADIAEAKEDFRKAKDAATYECRSGEGTRCKAQVKLRDQADSHYWLLVGRLASTKAEQVDNAGLKHAAKVFAALPFVTAEPATIERALVLFTPFVKALFLEIACIVFFGLGFGEHHSHQTAAPKIAPKAKPVGGGPGKGRKIDDQPAAVEPASASVIQFPGTVTKSKAEMLAFVLAEIEAGRSFPSQDAMARMAGVGKSAVCKWVKKWEADGLISTTRVGRFKSVGQIRIAGN